jgi:arylsulfatase A-like enzyme
MAERTPWFFHLSLLRPHPPFIAPEPYNALYHPDDVPGFRRAASPEDEARGHPYTAYMLRHHLEREGLEPEMHPNDERAMRQLRATYYGMMTKVDDNIGRLLAALKKTGQYDNTLIVLTSDHGEQLWDHWMLGKECPFDPSFHIPLIIRPPARWADKGRGRVVEAFTENVDVMPTILDWLGREAPMQCDGLSLLPFCRGETPAGWRQEAHWEYDFRDIVELTMEQALGLASDQCAMSVVRGARYKYVHFAALPPLFFDLEADPMEFRNLAGDPAYQGLMLEHAQKMLSWRMTHGERVLANQMLTPDGVVERRAPRW